METEIILKLAQEAKKTGGDKYSGQTINNEDINIYFPQSITRPDGKKPIESFKLTLEKL